MTNFGANALMALLLSASIIGPVCARGSVVSYIEPRNVANPAPAVPLNTFQRFEIQPIAMDAPFAGRWRPHERRA